MHISAQTIDEALAIYREKLAAGESPEWQKLQFQIGDMIYYTRPSKKTDRIFKYKRRTYSVSFFWQSRQARFFLGAYFFTPREGTSPLGKRINRQFFLERPTYEEIETYLQTMVASGGSAGPAAEESTGPAAAEEMLID